MTTTELQTQFYKETGIEVTNSQGEFDIDYVQWLEKKSIDSAKIREDEAVEFRDWCIENEWMLTCTTRELYAIFLTEKNKLK